MTDDTEGWEAAQRARPLTTDPAIAETMQEIRRMTAGRTGTGEPPDRRPMTEQEIQAADDAYFERMNRCGWR